MISHVALKDRDNLPAEVIELMERRQDVGEWPDSIDKVDAFDEIYAEAERLGVPHFMASARFEQFSVYFNGGRPDLAVVAYEQLLDVVDRYGDLIHPENRAGFRLSAPAFVSELMGMPEVPLEQIEGVIDRLERQALSEQGSLADIHLARATVAAGRGDRQTALQYMARWEADGSPDWSLDEDENVRIEIGVLDEADLEVAIERQQAALNRLRFDDAGYRFHVLTLASLLAQTGRRDEANEAVESVGTGVVGHAAGVPFADQLRALEPYDVIEEVAQAALRGVDLAQPGSLTTVAALARVLAGDDPDGSADLRRVAQWQASRLDARNGTDAKARLLADRWWVGLAPVEPARDADEADELLERVVLAHLDGPVVGFSGAPMTIRHSYAEVADIGQILSASSPEQAEELAAGFISWSEALRFPTGVGYAMYALCGYQLDGGNVQRGIDLVFDVQDFIVENLDVIDPSLVGLYADAFAVLAEGSLTSPTPSLERLVSLLDVQESLASAHDLAIQPVVLARATLAAQRGDTETMEARLAEALSLPDRGSSHVGLAELRALLAIVRVDVDTAASLLASLPDELTSSSEVMAQNFGVLSAYLARREGRAGEAAELAEALLEGAEGDLDELDYYTPIAFFISALDASPRFDELREPLEKLVRKGMPVTWESLAALAGVLLRRDPNDAHGKSLLAEALAHAEALDRRNGSTALADQLPALWL